MKQSTRILLLLAALLAALAAWPSAHAAEAEPDVPAAIAVLDGHKVSIVAHATGVQIYVCAPAAGGYAWSFVAPRATLYGDNGKQVATHFAGPTWRANDGSAVVARADGRADVAGTIPWLRLAAVSTSAGADGDRLAGTTYIQRVATTGGLAPPAGQCSAAAAGTTVEVPYTADYYFWKAAGR